MALPSPRRSLRQSVAARRSLEAGEGMPRDTLFGIRGTYHRQVPNKVVRQLSAAPPRRGRIDGPLTAAFKEALTGWQQLEIVCRYRHCPSGFGPIVATGGGCIGRCRVGSIRLGRFVG